MAVLAVLVSATAVMAVGLAAALAGVPVVDVLPASSVVDTTTTVAGAAVLPVARTADVAAGLAPAGIGLIVGLGVAAFRAVAGLAGAAFAAAPGIAARGFAPAAGVVAVGALGAAAPSRSATRGSPVVAVDAASLAAEAAAGAAVAGRGCPLTRAVIFETASVTFETAITEASTVLLS